jgi:hypothetical protein
MNFIEEFLTNENNIDNYKMNPQNFSRKSAIGIKELISFLLTKSNCTIQTRINQIFSNKDFEGLISFPTTSALIQQRWKLKPELLRDLNTFMVGKYYERNQATETLKLWNNHLTWAVDGTRIDIPDSSLNRSVFSEYRSRNLPNGKTQALGMLIHDTCNDLPLIGYLGPIKSEPKTFLDKILPILNRNPYVEQKDKAIFIFDRGYTDYSLFANLIQTDWKFLIRVKTSKTYKSIEIFRDSMEIYSIIEIDAPKYIRTLIIESNLPEKVKIRAVKVFLPTGEVEILITNLFDKSAFPTNCFKKLYFKRWPVETAIGFLKNVLDIERFSSKISVFIYQDFYASILSYTIGALFDKDIQNKGNRKYNKATSKRRKYWYKPNRRLILTSVVNYICAIICGDPEYKNYYYNLIMKWGNSQWVPIRNDRNIERKKKTDSGRLVVQLYYKKVYS